MSLLQTLACPVRHHQYKATAMLANCCTVTSLCKDCFSSQDNCPDFKMSLRGATAVRMQRLAMDCIVLTSRLSLHQVSLQREVTVFVTALDVGSSYTIILAD